MSDYNRRKRPAPVPISCKSVFKIAKSKTSSKPIPVFHDEIVRDVFANFDRMTLCRMEIVNHRFNSKIGKEFNNSGPYLILPELQYAYYWWSMDVGKALSVPVDLTVFQKIVASKFVRFQLLSVIYDMGFKPMKLLTIRHVWENGDLRVNWTCVPTFCPTEGLNRSFANCGKLFVNGSKAVSILHEMKVSKYRDLIIYDCDYDPMTHDIPWTKITDFLFRARKNDNSRNYIYIETDQPPNHQETTEFINSVKERFEAVDIALNFEFQWNAKFEKETYPEFDIQNILTTEAKKMRGSAQLGGKQMNSENEAEREPKAKKSQLGSEMPNIAAMDNGTMVETFKFLNYYQLATNSHVSKRFWNLIRTHRHKLALLDVKEIFMNIYVGNQDLAIIQMSNDKLSFEEYNEWIVRNGYSKQVPVVGQIAMKESTENDHDIYEFWADIYQGGNNCHNGTTTVFYAHAKLKDENWPLFQHFICLLMDPFIYIRTLELIPEKDVLSLLTGAMKPDRDRLQCAQLKFHFMRNDQELIVWIKDHIRCDKMLLDGYFDSKYGEEFLDLLMTGGLCTSAINVKCYDLSRVIVDLVKKFMHLKRRDECQIVESIRGYAEARAVIEEFKRNFAKFIAEEEQYEEDLGTRQVTGFINIDIEKKLTLNIENFRFGMMYDVSPAQTKLFHLRILLLHVKGPTSLKYIRTVDGIVYQTYQQACLKRGLTTYDQEWHRCLSDAKDCFMPVK